MKKFGTLMVALSLCLALFSGVGATSVMAEQVKNEKTAQKYSFLDFPYYTGQNNFVAYDAGYVTNVMKIGLFNKESENYGLKNFDVWNGANMLTSTEISGLSAENWKWQFADNSSVVIETTAKVNGTITYGSDQAALDGWMDAWNTIFSVYRKNSADNSVDVLAKYFQGVDSVSGKTIDDAQTVVASTYAMTVEVKTGDVVYYEIGSLSGGRNLQSVQQLYMEVEPTGISQAVVDSYNAKVDKIISGLVQSDYAADDWLKIEKYVTDFKGTSYDSVGEIESAFNTVKANIEAVKPDELKSYRTQLKTDMNNAYGALISSNYVEAEWAKVEQAYNDFIEQCEALTAKEDLDALYNEKYNLMMSVKAFKQVMSYLDYPATMNANGYNWIKGDVFDTKLYTGTVSKLIEFDGQGSNENIIYSKEINAGYTTPVYFAENWKWIVGFDASVITAFKANTDSLISIKDTRQAQGDLNGWTDNCTLSVYIKRGDDIRMIKEVISPVTDEDFSGSYYMKAGDIIYIEFGSKVINYGDIRNTESPYATVATGDSTKFDEELYRKQNNDLPKEVVDLLNEKQKLIEEQIASLKEEDYSATNWLEINECLEDYISASKIIVKTVEDVEIIYAETKKNIEDIPTLAEERAEVQVELDKIVAELQAEYDKLIKENDYTPENKKLLDEALKNGKEAISKANSVVVGKQEKISAVNAMAKIEKAVQTEASTGCGGSVNGSGVVLMGAILSLAIIMKRKIR